MTFNELMCNISNAKVRLPHTVYDSAYNDALDYCIKEMNKYVMEVPKVYFDAEEKLEKIVKEEKNKASETVNHPSHYNRDGAMECIDEMVYMFGYKATIDFCRCNAWKYRYRAGMKDNAEDDLKKSDWYIKKADELLKKALPVKTIKFSNNGIDAKIVYPNDETGVSYSENSSD